MHDIKVSLVRFTGRDAFYMQYRHPETGRKVQRTTGKRVRRDAERVAAKWEQNLLTGRDNRLGRIPWNEFTDRYENEVASGLADSTAAKIATMFTKVNEHIHPAKLGNVTADAMQRLQTALRTAGLSESTIKSHLAHLRAALAWAVNVGLLAAVPKVPKTQRAKATRVMKGRPIAGEEFDRMLAKVEAALCEANEPERRGEYKRWKAAARETMQKKRQEQAAGAAPSWQHLLRGLWQSGLRITEALELHWTDETKLHIDLSCRYPMLRIPAELEKGHKDRLLPIAPEFARFLLDTPAGRRHGYVFNPQPLRADKQTSRLGSQQVQRIIGIIGRLANVKVAEKPKGDAVQVKYASAHDLRRSFGERWATRVMPQVLMELMRHESIETTLRYYVGRNAQQTASVLWDAAKLAVGDYLGDTNRGTQETSKPHNNASHCGADD
jgi:integrase